MPLRYGILILTVTLLHMSSIKIKDPEEFLERIKTTIDESILAEHVENILVKLNKLTTGNAGSAGGADSDVISSLRTQLQEKEREIQGLKSSIYDKDIELGKCKSKSTDCADSAELKSQIAKLENDLNAARDSKNELESKLLNAESLVKSQEKKISQLEASARDAVSPETLAECKNTIDEQAKRIEELTYKAEEADGWKSRYEDEKNSLDKTGAELARVKNEIKVKEANWLDEIKKLTDAHHSELNRLNDEHQRNIDKQEQIRKDLEADYTQRLKNLEQEHEKAISAKETSLEEYRKVNADIVIANRALQNDKEVSERCCKELTTQLTDTQQQVVTLKDNIASLNNSLSDSNTANAELRSKYDRLQSQLDATQERAEQSEASVKALLALQNRVFPECLNIEALAPYVGEWRKQLVEETPDPKVLSMLAHIFSWNCAKETAARCPDVPAIIAEKDAITALYNFSRYFFDVLYSQNVDAETAEKVAYALVEYINRELEQTGAKYEVELAYCGDSFDSKVMQPDPRGTSTGEVYMLRSWCIKNRANSSVHVKSLVQLC